MSVVRLAARHVATRAPGKPFVLVGYSNGGALAIKYAQDVLEGSGLPRPDRIVLLSPMIGLTPFAGLARVVRLLHRVPFFEKNAWLDVLPEYNPYKYNSFPANAAIQTSNLTKALNAQTGRLAADGRLKDLAPVLTFQSLVDNTVLTEAIVRRLYDRLPANGSELVLFDINREDMLGPFLKLPEEALARDLKARTDLKYRLTVVTNARRDTRDVVARSWGPGPTRSEQMALGLAWPPDVFSLSHVAIPFPESDDLYGRLAEPRADVRPQARARRAPRRARGPHGPVRPVDAPDVEPVLPLDGRARRGVVRYFFFSALTSQGTNSLPGAARSTFIVTSPSGLLWKSRRAFVPDS